ncbi:hypothetical protein NLK61_01035 [Pseudomonas fuscovaginae UPB0736]|uniref:hypothetical protein n=1 Tax=Pseudomonas asplenii TaxID=53407 RepID=UPI000287AB04|nr:hypothetical protein [Pseudomonas fuscovaginae]UUQ65265.1 hypothetical protein NLK61_01035 [Pseudomonas fuscovaginae UPB0736]
MKRIAVVATLGLLSACSLQPARNSGNSAALFGDILKQPPLADSVLRDGDQLSYQAQVASGKVTATPDIAQLQASCAKTDASLLFVESTSKLAADGQPERVTVMRKLLPVVVANLQQNPAFIEACAHTPRPDWRLVGEVEAQRQLLIDRASLKNVAGAWQFWGAIDEPSILINQQKKMPYAQTRLRLQANCTSQTYRSLAEFALNQNNVVTFGKTETATQDKPFDSAEATTQMLLKTVCAGDVANKLERSPSAVPRNKTALVLTPTPVPATVLAAIDALELPPASKPLRRLVLERNSGSVSLRYELFFEPGAQSGQLHQREVGKYSTSNKITFRGLFNLTFQSQYKNNGLEVSVASNVEQLSFSGDWKQMPVGQTIGFSLKERNRNSSRPESLLSRQDSCLVKRELPASKIHSNLGGIAKELACTSTGEKRVTTSTVYYLQDSGYFFSSKSATQDLYKEDMKLLQVE